MRPVIKKSGLTALLLLPLMLAARSPGTGRLTVADDVQGKLSILDANSHPVIEIKKPDHKPLTLDLSPGRYTLHLVQGEQFYYCDFTIGEGEEVTIGLTDLVSPEGLDSQRMEPVPAPPDREKLESEYRPPEENRRCILRPWWKRGNFHLLLESSLRSLRVNGERDFFAGGNIAVILDRHLIIGLGGHTNLSAWVDFANQESDPRPTILSYGGLLLGYTPNSQGRISTRVTLLSGIGYQGTLPDCSGEDESWCAWWDQDDWRCWHDNLKAFFFMEPEIALFWNLTRHVRFSLALSYRYIDGDTLDTRKWAWGLGLNFRI
jgi:hypothetical protein